MANIPTEILIDRPCVILTGKIVLTTNDVVELEQIQRELQSRADDERWIRSAN